MVKNCPKCGTVMEESSEDFADMTDGQIENYDSGFERPFYCPNCKTLENYDINMSSSEKNLPKLSEKAGKIDARIPAERRGHIFSSIKGIFTEQMAMRLFKDNKYIVIKCVKKYYDEKFQPKTALNKEWIEGFCGKQKELLMLLNSFENNVSGLPDFLCIRNDDILFVECKCDASKISEAQKTAFAKIKEAGFVVKLFQINFEKFEIDPKFKIEDV